MKIIVKAKTKAKENKVERVGQPVLDLSINNSDKKREELVTYKVSVKEAPVDGKANLAIIQALAEYFDVAKPNITLISGQSSKQKVFEIL
jgi:uncharacterized protein YggU (UPF0235/DUF167 family)